MTNFQRHGEKIASAVFGLLFIITSIVLSVRYPEPTVFQYNVFSSVLAISAAGVAAIIPGTIRVEIPKFIKAGGAIAIFIVVFLFSPAKYIALEPTSGWNEQSVSFTASNSDNPRAHLNVRGAGIANVLSNRIKIHVSSVEINYPSTDIGPRFEHILRFYTGLMCITDQAFDFSGWSSQAYDISKDLHVGDSIEIKNFNMEIPRPKKKIDLSTCFIMLVVYYGESMKNYKGQDIANASPNMFE
ncbi:hypothetical protein PS918_02702 [Pseudomonas fluorescens]|uniref:Uncharacterized protein n=1 Tax=Pseudomonas fluorescens TaxID=294 RepID=A0A5E7SHP5_PSEFL|nr:hypothetical protein [Pseudomonas fluorescens]VVP85167.1 hypothetical protein PS918_02702 [Pseudomonas fluorescens]